MDNADLRNAVCEALLQLETEGHIVIVSTIPVPLLNAIANKVAEVILIPNYPSESCTPLDC